MKFLVTGGAGFIGSAVVRLAISSGHHVVNLDSLTYAGNPDNLAEVISNPRYVFEHADICDRAALDRIFAVHQPDVVMNLAAESHVDRSIDGPRVFIDTNIGGTCTLLEAARRYWTARGRFKEFRFHQISTDEVYGSLGPPGRFTESSACAPNNPYSAAKAGGDHLVRAWHETWGLPTLLTNASNTYGPYQFPEKLIPVVILNALAGTPIPVYGQGLNIRDWLFVEDHARALLCVAARGAAGRRYNIGGGAETTNLEIVRNICAILDRLCPRQTGFATQIRFVEDRPGHDLRYAIDSTRIRKELGWRPTVTLHQGLEKAVAWFLENQVWWQRFLPQDPDHARRSGVAI